MGGASTYDRVDYNLNHARRDDEKHATPADETTAAATIAWVRSLDTTDAGLSDYEYNLAVACRPEYVEFRVLGIVTSAVAAYQRAQAQAIERAEAAAASEWQGEVGKKLTVNATILSRFDSEGTWGVTHIIKFRDVAGNRYVWFCSSLPEVGRMEHGGPLYWNPQAGQNGTLITGTVKSHNEYRGVKETVLTRCKVSIKEA
jgi:hypothetical protein